MTWTETHDRRIAAAKKIKKGEWTRADDGTSELLRKSKTPGHAYECFDGVEWFPVYRPKGAK